MPVGDRLAVLADTARLAVVAAVQAVQRLGQDARGGGLAGAPRPAEEVRVADPVVAHRVAQRGGHVLLADQLAEPLGSVLAVERLIGHRRPMLERGARRGNLPSCTGCSCSVTRSRAGPIPAIRDHDRPLNDRGRRAATLMGDHLAEAGLAPRRRAVLVGPAHLRDGRAARPPDVGRDRRRARPLPRRPRDRVAPDPSRRRPRRDRHGDRPQPDDARGRPRPRRATATRTRSAAGREVPDRRARGASTLDGVWPALAPATAPPRRVRHASRARLSEMRTVHPPSTRPLHVGSRRRLRPGHPAAHGAIR